MLPRIGCTWLLKWWPVLRNLAGGLNFSNETAGCKQMGAPADQEWQGV
jgi:hypothetical protein